MWGIDMLKKIPLEEIGFEELIRGGYYYVDKTMYLKEFVPGHIYVQQLLRRECSGKTLLLSMMQSFLEVGRDSALFDGLAIAEDREFCDKHMGQYPVVSLNWKEVQGSSFVEAIAAMKRVVATEAKRFSYLLESEKLRDNEKIMYRKVADENMSDELLDISVYTLTELLHKHYGKCVVLLVDGCDIPSYYACQNGYAGEMAYVIGHMCNWACKTNEHLQFAVFAGSLRFFREKDIMGSFNNLVFRDASWDNSCGFTEEEVDALLAYYGLSGFKDVFQEWYGGYPGGVYDPYGVMKYCEALHKDLRKRPVVYRRDSIGEKLVMQMLENSNAQVRYDMEQLMQKKGLFFEVKKLVTYEDVFSNRKNVYSALCNLGFFVKRDDKLVVANRSIRSNLVCLIEIWFWCFIHSGTERIDQFYKAVENKDTETMESILYRFFFDAIITAETEEEQEAFVLMLLRELLYRESWIYQKVSSPICIAIRSWDDVAVVIGGKYGDVDEACSVAKKTLECIRMRPGLCDGMKKLVAYGIGFNKRTCEVRLVE